MERSDIVKTLISVLGCLMLTSCAARQVEPASATFTAPTPEKLEAVFTTEPITIDGSLGEPIWRKAPAYKLLVPSRTGIDAQPEEAGTVRLCWDHDYLYMGVEFDDSDLVDEGDADGLAQYNLADVAELFLKPPGQTWYWELHVTPKNHQTCYFYPGPGRRGLPSSVRSDLGVKTAVRCQGTINHWEDVDKGWTAEMAVPMSVLTMGGTRLDPQTPWRVFVGRYNYTRYRTRGVGPEESCYPWIPDQSFHNIKEWGSLVLVR